MKEGGEWKIFFCYRRGLETYQHSFHERGGVFSGCGVIVSDSVNGGCFLLEV